MNITLLPRTPETVRIYFDKASQPYIRRVLPQKAQTVEEALVDYEKSLLPDATSFGLTIHADGRYIGDVWCYCIDLHDEPNCMLSYCVFEPAYWSKGIATTAVGMFIREIRRRFSIRSIGAFTYAHNAASIRVLEKNGFTVRETFKEDGVSSQYLQLDG